MPERREKRTMGYCCMPTPSRMDTRRGECFSGRSFRLFPNRGAAIEWALGTESPTAYEVVEVYAYV